MKLNLNTINKFLHSKLCYIIFILFSLTAIGMLTYFKTYSCDFYPINGDFQNYNVVRRLYAGQTPFKDFMVYLGCGHLCLGSLLTLILGGKFADSIIAFQLLSAFSACLTVYGVCRAFWKNNGIIPFLAFVSLFIVKRYLVVFLEDDVNEMAIEALRLLSAGNSARSIRAMFLGVILLFMSFIPKAENYIKGKAEQLPRFYAHKNAVMLAVASVFAGVSFIWSNDYGICGFIALNITVLTVVYAHQRKLLAMLKALAAMLAGSFLTVFILISLITKGHFGIWVEKCLFSSSYQAWYYNFCTDKTYYFYDIDLFPTAVVCAAFSILYFFKMLKKCDDSAFNRYMMLFFANITAFGATQEYYIFGGGDVLHGTVSLIAALTVVCNIVFVFGRTFLKKGIAFKIIFSAFCVLLFIYANIGMFLDENAIYKMKYKYGGVYVPELGGTLTSNYPNYIYTQRDYLEARDFTGNSKLFSEYASAIETTQGRFQPSGTDYIIHLLSDKARERYMDVFHSNDFDYVVTVKEYFDLYAYWIRNANWFFTREVFRNFTPVFETNYSVYWKRSSEDEIEKRLVTNGIKLKTIKVSENETDIIIHTDEKTDGLADVHISYSSAKKPGLRSLFIHGNVVAVNWGDEENSWCLRPESDEYIPIEIVNGEGRVALHSEPARDTVFELKEADCGEVIKIPSDMRYALSEFKDDHN